MKTVNNRKEKEIEGELCLKSPVKGSKYDEVRERERERER